MEYKKVSDKTTTTNMNFIDFIKRSADIYIFGATKHGSELYECISDFGGNVVAYVDNDSNKWGKQLGEGIVLSLDQVSQNGIFVIAVEHYYTEIVEQLQRMNVCIDDIYCPDLYELLILKLKNPIKWRCEDSCYMYHNPIKYEDINNYHECETGKIYGENRLLKEKKYYISVCAIFKNEAMYLKEWIEYHLLVGIEHFFLYNNMSDDKYLDVLSPYISSGVVTLIEWPYAKGQISAYMDCSKKYREVSNWIGFIDIDEFINPLEQENITSVISRYESAGSVMIPWRIYGSSGMVDRNPDSLVIDSFFDCWSKLSDVGKCIWNTEYDVLDDNPIFHHYLWTLKDGKKQPAVNIDGIPFTPNLLPAIRRNPPMVINHYAVKSLNEYMMKVNKTDVFFEKNSHNMNAFEYHDIRCSTKDFSMKRFVKKICINV